MTNLAILAEFLQSTCPTLAAAQKRASPPLPAHFKIVEGCFPLYPKEMGAREEITVKCVIHSAKGTHDWGSKR